MCSSIAAMPFNYVEFPNAAASPVSAMRCGELFGATEAAEAAGALLCEKKRIFI